MGIRDERVLWAIEQVPRRRFVPELLQADSEADRPLPIGHGQTISQPFIVGLMTEALGLTGVERVLEVGTGSGYQCAVLALLAREVFSAEIVPELAEVASEVLIGKLNLRNVRLRVGDGRRVWADVAPFDRVIVTAAPSDVPAELVDQLTPGGKMVVPVGEDPEVQTLKLLQRGNDGTISTVDLLPVRFVPLTGEHG